MKNVVKYLAAAFVGGALVLGGAVTAQITLPLLQNATNTDYIPDIVGGFPVAGNKYAEAGMIASVQLYKWGGTITTDPGFTFPNGTLLYSAHKASTLSTATITTEANPTDGKRECYVLDQTTTTLTWTANTSQTVDTSVRASGVASVPTCIFYDAANATWYQSN